MYFEFITICSHCAEQTRGRFRLDDYMKIVDSDGGVLFGDGWMCHNCLGEPWSSSDLVVTLP